MDSAVDYLWLCATAFAAGGVNALAGGGTLLTFPTLIGVLTPRLGTAADVFANGTSTVALAPASLGSSWAFRRELAQLWPVVLWLLIPSLAGGLIGSSLVIRYPDHFNALVPWLILTAATLFLVQPLLVPRKTVALTPNIGIPEARHAAQFSFARLLPMIGLQFLIAIYGGYFGAGIGILMLSGLGLMGFSDIHEMNGIKSVLATAINGIAAGVFIWQGKVLWNYALTMTVASVFGGVLAASFGRRVAGKWIRYFVVAIGFLLAAWFFLARA
jgi:uncharacterized protein